MTKPSKLQRIDELLERYRAEDACVAALLCDRHDPGALAYRIVSPDLVAQNLTYGELRHESEMVSGALCSAGIAPGDRVATLMGKSRHYLVTLLAIWRLGAVHVPLFTAFAPSAIALRLIGSGAKVVVCDSAQSTKLQPGEDMPANPAWRIVIADALPDNPLSLRRLMERAEPVVPAVVMGGDAPFIHIYTSGTTGSPKAVIVPIRALASFHAYAEFGLGLTAEDIFWCAADPGWAYGLYFGVIATFATGASSILLEGGFAPEVTLGVLANEGVTNFAAAPTVYRALRSSGLLPTAPLRLRCASSAGEPLTPEVIDWSERVLGVTVHDHYGQTETGMLINNHHHPLVRCRIKAGSMGQAMPGWKATILQSAHDDEAAPNEFGRIAMIIPESPLAWFTGYDGYAARTAEKFAGNGRWYVTGDTGFVDDDGYFHFAGRDDDVIIMAGYRIGPLEVESVMASHPAVLESAVIAVPDEFRGEVIVAYVVLREGNLASPELEREIQQWVKSRYAAHAYPRVVHFAAALPKTPSGKIQRFILKQQRCRQLDERR